MCILARATPDTSPAVCPAKALTPPQRRHLALQALTGQPVAHLARRHHVSRRFVYRQAGKAEKALGDAFAPEPPAAADPVLFHLPVTRTWLRQLTLGLVLICHSSYRGVTELLTDLFDYPLSVGHVHDVVHDAVASARGHTARHDLAGVRVGAHDEIFQGGRPVLVGVDVASTYCYLLSAEEHRDADTWGVRLLELAERGFHPAATVADGGAALRAGQELALPGVPCRGDVFHALHEFRPLATYLENRAYEAIATRSRLEHRQAQGQRRRGRKSRSVAAQLRQARPAEARAIALAEEVALLLRWLREDVLAVAGPDAAGRRALYDFVVTELRAREAHCPHRIRPVRRLLEHQRDALLAFAAQQDRDLEALARECQAPVALLREALHVGALAPADPRRWQREAGLWRQLGGRYPWVRAAVAALARHTVRASSVAENVNSRLRGYFFLRRQLGPDYLALLQFFLNHRRFLRSEHPGRVGKSPAELLTGQRHPHWLALLGYQPFTRD